MKKILTLLIVSVLLLSCKKELPLKCSQKGLEQFKYTGVHTSINSTDAIGVVTLDYKYTLTNTQAEFWLLNDLPVTLKPDGLYTSFGKIGYKTDDSLRLRYTVDSTTISYVGYRTQ